MFPQLFGKYMLEREIASGGMARVYLATLRGAGGFEKRLVVKQIRPEFASDSGFIERFVKEAKTAVELSHPNIVPVYELGVEQGVYYIAMEHCDGSTLSDVLAATGPLNPEEGAYLGVEVCRALDYAHRRAQVIHRDVTPRNVLIDEEGAIRLIDFGIAAPVADGNLETRAEIFGSPGHMPPEQLAGHAVTPATDVFAVGVLLYEALTGRPAFRRTTLAETRLALDQNQPAIDASAEKLAPLAPIVSGAMRLDQQERPQNAEALARPLREFLRKADTGDVARHLGERVRKQRRQARVSSPWLVGEGMAGLPNPRSELADATRVAASTRTPAFRTRTFATSQSFTQLTRRAQSEPPAPTGASSEHATRRLISSPPPHPAPAATKLAGAIAAFRGSKLLVIALLALTAVVLAALSTTSSGFPVPVERAASPTEVHTAASAPVRDPLAAPDTTEARLPVSSVRQPSLELPSQKPTLRDGPGQSVSTARSASSAGFEAQAAELSLTALAGTQVTVAGRSLTTPVTGLSLPSGQYRVTFENPTWDGVVAAQISLLPGKQSRVHADFTSEPPRVVVR